MKACQPCMTQMLAPTRPPCWVTQKGLQSTFCFFTISSCRSLQGPVSACRQDRDPASFPGSSSHFAFLGNAEGRVDPRGFKGQSVSSATVEPGSPWRTGPRPTGPGRPPSLNSTHFLSLMSPCGLLASQNGLGCPPCTSAIKVGRSLL